MDSRRLPPRRELGERRLVGEIFLSAVLMIRAGHC